MTEYIEREAVFYVFDEAVKTWRPDIGISKAEYLRIRYKNLPAADVRPVVLCRECKHWETSWTPQGVSDGRHYCAPLDLYPSADWFCSYGEKMEES